MNKCLGCGIPLQTMNPEELGYTTNLESEVCERCFRLKHYGEYKSVSLNNQDYQKIISEIPKNSIVVYVADLLSLDLSNLPKKYKTVLVLTKRDILPKSIKDEKIIQKMKSIYPQLLEVICVSSLKNYQIDRLYNFLKQHENGTPIYFIGNTNSGKSTLLNQLIKNYAPLNQNREITVSMYPSTTLSQVEIELEHLKLIDTPGLVDQGNYANILPKNDLKKITPKKEIKPRSCQINGKGSLLIGEYARIDYQTKEQNSFVVYTAPTVKSNFISSKNDILKDGKLNHYTLKDNQDIVLPGLGFIKFTKPITVTIYTPIEIESYIRDNLI